MTGAILLLPFALLLLSGRKRKQGGAGPDQDPYNGGWASRDEIDGLNLLTEDGYPLSDSMLLNDDCSGPAAKAIKWRYDLRITHYYWYLRRELEYDDPVAIAAEILGYDSPHCPWPAPPDAPEWAHIIWDGTLAAVTNYYDLEQSGELWDYAEDPFDPSSLQNVKPLVVWA